jgi:hypothetical protein
MIKVTNRTASPLTVGGKHLMPGKSLFVKSLNETDEYLQRVGSISAHTATPAPVIHPTIPQQKPAIQQKSVPMYRDRKER